LIIGPKSILFQNEDWQDNTIIVQWFSKMKSGTNDSKYILKDWYGKISQQSVVATGVQMKTVWKFSVTVKHLVVDHYRVITPIASIKQIMHGRFHKIVAPVTMSNISPEKLAKLKANRFMNSISNEEDVKYIAQRFMEIC
jgi:hypothetical protein